MIFVWVSIFFFFIHINFSNLTSWNTPKLFVHLVINNSNAPIYIMLPIIFTLFLNYLPYKTQYMCIHNLIYLTIGYSVNLLFIPNHSIKSFGLLGSVLGLLCMYGLLKLIPTSVETNGECMETKGECMETP